MAKYDWLNQESKEILERGYLLPGQTVEEKIDKICKSTAKFTGFNHYLDLAEEFKKVFENGWASMSSPIWANAGEERGLPISCVTGETWINTDKGGKQARDISIGDLVLTHSNRFRPISNIIVTENKDDIYKLKVGTRMTNLYITGNHPVLTNYGWVKVEELDKEKHLVAVNGELAYTPNDYTIDMKKFINYPHRVVDGLIFKVSEATVRANRTKSRNKKGDLITYYSSPKEFVEITEDLAWAFGLWFAEGSLTINNRKLPNGIRITTNINEEAEAADRWLDIMSKAFNLNGKAYISEVTRKGKLNTWKTVNFNGGPIGELFASFGKGAKNKEVPEWILSLPKSKLQKFLDGILLGDGSINNKTNKLTLSNPKLLLQIYNIGLKLGHSMSLQMQEKAGCLASTSHVYTVIFRDYLVSASNNSANAGIPFYDGLIYCPIKTLEKTDKVETVYDFTVEEDHSFSCAGVVVHNCFSSYCEDSISGIFDTLSEVAMMTKLGGGTAGYFGEIRAEGSSVTDGGTASGVMSFLKLFDKTTEVVNQSGVRRGAFAAYLPIDHPEINEFLSIKDKKSDLQTINTAVNVPNKWMDEMIAGDKEKRNVWAKVLKSRREKGIPYIAFIDTINENKPQVFKDNNMIINQLNLCSEVALPTNKDESLVCCLLSMNLDKYDEWKDTNAVELMVWFLDGIMSEFIHKAKDTKELRRAVKFAERTRSLGLGVLGWHSYLQGKQIPFDSIQATALNKIIFKDIENKALIATQKLYKILGTTELLEPYGVRNATLLTLAPTTSSSAILGQVSPSIEPYKSNCYNVELAKGGFLRKNKYLQKVLKGLGKDTETVWDDILLHGGSVQHLDFLSQQEKEVFKTFQEINPYAIIRQAADRQKFIDQSQSLNLMIPQEMSIKDINAIIIEAYKLGVKSLYYQRGTSLLKEQVLKMMECTSCSA